VTTTNYNDDVVLYDHIKGVVDALDAGCPFPVGDWERPKDVNERFIDPPYALVRLFPSTGQFNGPLTNTQADVVLRIQVMAAGFVQLQALEVQDITRKYMYRENITIPNRYIQKLRFMVSSGGVSRDDDLPTPLLFSYDVYELWTTPLTV
jgi:hypothetical protein